MAERRPSQRDIERAIRAAEAAGKEVVRVEIEGGKLVIVMSDGETVRRPSEWRKRIEALS